MNNIENSSSAYQRVDNVIKLEIHDEIIEAIYSDGSIVKYDINEPVDFSHSGLNYLFFMMGYMKAEKFFRLSYSSLSMG